jgi:hypothetical protein
MRRGLFVILILMHPAAQAAQDRPLPESEPFLQRVREHLRPDSALQNSYAYLETRRELKFDKHGRTTGVSEKVFENYPGFPGEHRWERLIAEDGTPVPPEELEEVDRRRQEKAASYARRLRERPEQEQARQLRQQKEVEQQATDAVADIFSIYEIRMLRREIIDGHHTIAFSLMPRPDARPRTREGRDMRHFSATAWVSESDFEVVRVDVVAIHTVKMGLGVGVFARLHEGARLSFVRRKINGEIWLPATSIYEGSARLGLIRTVRQRGESSSPTIASSPSIRSPASPLVRSNSSFPSGESAGSSRNVDQPDHILADPIVSHEAERRPGPGEIGAALTEHDRVQVDPILVDQAKFGQASRQVRAGNFDLAVAPGLQLADCPLEIICDDRGIGTDRLERARDDPFRLPPPRRREGSLVCIPFRLVVVPVTHDFVHVAAVDAARLTLSLLDEVAEQGGAWRKRRMVDVAVQGLVHSKHEPGHDTSFSSRGTSARC